MVDATKAMESSYVNVDLVRDSPTRKCVILDPGEYVDAEYQGKHYAKLQLNVEIDKKIKIWCPNKDSAKNIAQEYGHDTENWTGRIIKLSIGKVLGKDTVIGIPLPMVDNNKA